MKKKLGLTMIELLITMVIIGIVTVFGLKTIIHNDKVVRYAYSNVYHSLDKALYNSFYATALPNPFLTKDSVSGAEVTLNDNQRVTRLCNMFTEYINVSAKSCNLPPVATINSATLQTPHFVSMNNVRFYISKRFPASESSDHFFFLVFADLNGAKKPNSMTYNPPKTDPDIFAFAALDIARVCPLGPPEIDQRFMQTRIVYNDPNNSEVESFTQVSKPYYISKAEAWGYYLKSGRVDADESFYIEENPLTYNGYVKKALKKESTTFYNNIYGFMGDSSLTAPATVELKSKKVSENGYGCVKGSDIECDVIIDKYLY